MNGGETIEGLLRSVASLSYLAGTSAQLLKKQRIRTTVLR